MSEEAFRPWIGRRSQATGNERYLGRVLAASGYARFSFSPKKVVWCAIVGRGAGIGRLLRATSRSGSASVRRGIVKVRLIRLDASKTRAATTHVRYIQRDGVQRDGSAGLLYSRDSDSADGRVFTERCSEDRHQFRIVVSPEDGDQYENLRPVVRRFMAHVEKDLGTTLDWIAADHVDTAHPHSHVVIRGKDDRGGNLVIAREYLSHGMRERLSDVLTDDLGPTPGHDIRASLRLEISTEGYTSFDRSLEDGADESRLVQAGHRDPLQHALMMGRLKKLETLGLAEQRGPCSWRLAHDLRLQLSEISNRHQIFRSMQVALATAGIERSRAEQVVHSKTPIGGLVGRVLDIGSTDHATDGQYVIIDGLDGRTHYVHLGPCANQEAPSQAIVRLTRSEGGSHDPESSCPNAKVQFLSLLPIERLGTHEGVTWLDRQLGSASLETCRNAGFGAQVKEALALRRNWLCDHGLAREVEGRFVLPERSLATLRRREFAKVATRLSEESGVHFAALPDGTPIGGTFAGTVDLASERCAVVREGRQLWLVPWLAAADLSLDSQIARLVHDADLRRGVCKTLSREI